MSRVVPRGTAIEHDGAADWARIVLELRRRRTDYLPADLFGEHSWNLLLVLFVADANGDTMSAEAACEEAGGSPGLVKRWLGVLEEHGLVSRTVSVRREEIVALTPQGVHAVEGCMIDSHHMKIGHVGVRPPR